MSFLILFNAGTHKDNKANEVSWALSPEKFIKYKGTIETS